MGHWYATAQLYNRDNGHLPLMSLSLPVPNPVPVPVPVPVHIPMGLMNRSNICYMNSVLQCLTYNPLLLNYCLSKQHSSLCQKNQNECAFCLLQKWIQRSLENPDNIRVEEALPITNNVNLFAPHYANTFPHQQEDASEFLLHVVDACNEVDPNETRIFDRIFRYSIRHRRTCQACNHSSHCEEHNYVLSLAVYRCASINHCLNNEFEEEAVEFICDKCKNKGVCLQKSFISETPNVLAIQFKRFTSSSAKIDRLVRFYTSLRLKREYLSEDHEGEDVDYDLYAVIVHSGMSIHSGHYYAFVKDSNGAWFKCNDANVSPATLRELFSQRVYMLFYVRRTPPASMCSRASTEVEKLEGESRHRKRCLENCGDSSSSTSTLTTIIKRMRPSSPATATNTELQNNTIG